MTNKGASGDKTLQKATVVKRIRIWHSSDGRINYIHLFDKAGDTILQMGNSNSDQKHDTYLDDNERIIGVRARCNADTSYYLYDL